MLYFITLNVKYIEFDSISTVKIMIFVSSKEIFPIVLNRVHVSSVTERDVRRMFSAEKNRKHIYYTSTTY